MVLESPKQRNHPGEEEMKATWSYTATLKNVTVIPGHSGLIFLKMLNSSQRNLRALCRSVLYVAHYAVLCAVLNHSVVSNYATKS